MKEYRIVRRTVLTQTFTVKATDTREAIYALETLTDYATDSAEPNERTDEGRNVTEVGPTRAQRPTYRVRVAR